MPDYSKGKIYTIRCRTDDNLIYVGSTIQPLSVRFANHKRNKGCSLYEYINDNYIGTWSNWYIELYELYPCNSKMELERKEGEIQRQIATINKRVAGRTIKEYCFDNKDKISENKKEYYQDNKNNILKNKKEYYQDNKDRILEFRKIYYENNKDKRLEYQKGYCQENEEKISEYKKEYQKVRTICGCGCELTKQSLSSHKKTQKHKELLSNLAILDIQSNIPVLPE